MLDQLNEKINVRNNMFTYSNSVAASKRTQHVAKLNQADPYNFYQSDNESVVYGDVLHFKDKKNKIKLRDNFDPTETGINDISEDKIDDQIIMFDDQGGIFGNSIKQSKNGSIKSDIFGGRASKIIEEEKIQSFESSSDTYDSEFDGSD